MDSDGDGMPNGEELGDPDCEWTPGSSPKYTSGLSHPGKPLRVYISAIYIKIFKKRVNQLTYFTPCISSFIIQM